MITREEIEQRRTPRELQEFVERTRSRVEADRPELKLARHRVGLYKLLIDEVMPLSMASLHICDQENQLLPVYGSQGYDAIVFDASGREKDRIEIAKPYDGKASADDANLMEQRGYGAITVRDWGEGLSDMFEVALATAKKKSLKDYRDSTLLFAVIPDLPPYEEEIPVFEKRAKELCDELRQFHFMARRVILVVPPLPSCHVVQG